MGLKFPAREKKKNSLYYVESPIIITSNCIIKNMFHIDKCNT